MLTLDDLNITQGDFRLSAGFAVPMGTTTAILGPSGAGKSTLLSVIGGFFAPTSGRVTWEGRDLTAMPPAKRPMAHLFQDNNLFPHMTAAQNVGLGIKPTLRLSPADKRAVQEALAATGLGDMGNRRPAQLSGGQQSRVALARVLVQRQPLVLLDEPFSALGPAMRKDMTALARDVGARIGATMLMVSHDLGDAQAFADQVIWVEGGEAHPPRTWTQIAAHPPQGYRDYIGH
ncbi:ATP-binding cassette domain-containing protein [Celeribacter sp.]|uniref:thiamine ABC transporter ATP-binding protein n=1 Tax=Celeribacter sp. TaxID=1890673 RepID=UPI003A8CC186